MVSPSSECRETDLYFWMKDQSVLRVAGSTPLVGSSNSTRGQHAMYAMATHARRFSPPETQDGNQC